MNRRLGIGLLFQFLLAASLMAQQDRGTIMGTVTDSSGAVVPGVSVTAVNVATAVPTSGATNEVGLYRLLNLPIGQYNLSFRKEGFQTLERGGITLTIAQVAEVNAQLQVGAVTQTIEVRAPTPILNTQTNVLGSTIGLQQIADLPLSIYGGRDASMFAYATIPGVEGDTWSSYISGTQQFSKEILIDGTMAQASETGTLAESYPSMEAVQEFKVDTGGGGGSTGLFTAAGTFMYTLKSGTNVFHGSAFGFLRNEALNANSWANNYFGLPKGRDREVDYGFSAGGPVVVPHVYNGRNKTFFFAAFEQYRQKDLRMGTINDTVPTVDFLEGDLSALLNKSVVLGTDAGGNTIYQGAIFDPGTGLVFPDNVIDQSRFSEPAKKIIQIYKDYYPPLNDGIINNNAEPASGNPYFHQTQFSLKIDHSFSDKDRLTSSVIHTDRPQFQVGGGGVGNHSEGPWSWNGKDILFGGPLSQARWHDIPAWRAQLSWSHNFSPNVLNVASYTFNSYYIGDESVHTGEGWQAEIGFPDIPGSGTFPRIDFGDAVNGIWEDTLGWPGTNPGDWKASTVDEKLDWIKGRHTISLGGSYRAFQMDAPHAGGNLSFYFSNLTTGAPTEPYSSQVGFGFASFLLGDVYRADEARGYSLYGRRKSGAVFVQDKFKVSDRLTLNYGLNWTHYAPLKEKFGRWANFNTTGINPVLGIPGVVDYLSDGSQTFEGKPDWKTFNPHIGAAIKLTSKAVFRAAYSIYYVPIGTDNWGGVPYSFAPGYFPTNIVNPPPNYAPAFNWDDGYPGVWQSGTLDPNYLTWGMVSIDPHSLEVGRLKQWNAGIEYQIAANTRLSVNYLGNRGTRLHDGLMQSNQPSASTYSSLLESGHFGDWVSDAASAAAAGVPYPYAGFAGNAWMAIDPFPQISQQYGFLFFVGSPLGRSQYDALQIELVQRASHGITADFSYNLARFRTNTTNNNFAETWNTDYILQDLSDVSGYDANYIKPYNQHIFKGYIQWALPFGTGRRFLSSSGKLVDAVLGNWSLGSVLYLSTGKPMRISSSNYYPGWNAAVYANVASGADFSRRFDGKQLDLNNPANPSNQYFDPSAFSDPAFGSFGNSGPYVVGLNDFGTYTQDLAIIKEFRMGERFRLQLRGEFYDVFNRHYFNSPYASGIDTNIASPYFGQVTSVQPTSRIGQVGARIQW
jgi:hypothetical protein